MLVFKKVKGIFFVKIKLEFLGFFLFVLSNG